MYFCLLFEHGFYGKSHPIFFFFHLVERSSSCSQRDFLVLLGANELTVTAFTTATTGSVKVMMVVLMNMVMMVMVMMMLLVEV